MKYAVVTGYMSGMGKAAAESLTKSGYHVIGWDIGGTPRVDVSSSKDVAQAAAQITEPIDAVVLAAGIWRESTLLETTDEDWNSIMNINAFGVFNCIRALVPHLKPGGSIAIVISASGMRGIMYESVYSASKFAVSGLVEALAPELALKKIRINGVCPFYVRTPMTDRALILKEQMTGITVEESYRLEAQQVPLGWVAESSEIADLLTYLVSDASSYVTGAVIPISGGAHCGYGPVLTAID